MGYWQSLTFKSSLETSEYFIIFTSVWLGMNGRVLQIARTDVVHSRK